MKMYFFPNVPLIYKIINRSCSLPESSTLAFSYYEILFYDISYLNPFFLPFMMSTDDDFALGRDDGNISMHLLCSLLSLLLKTHLKSTEASLKSNLQSAAITFSCRFLEALGDCFI